MGLGSLRASVKCARVPRAFGRVPEPETPWSGKRTPDLDFLTAENVCFGLGGCAKAFALAGAKPLTFQTTVFMTAAPPCPPKWALACPKPAV